VEGERYLGCREEEEEDSCSRSRHRSVILLSYASLGLAPQEKARGYIPIESRAVEGHIYMQWK